MSRPRKHTPSHSATLDDVGRAVGVSKTAVAAVLNHARSSAVSPATRERILAAATKLRYRPNATARALANGRMQALGVVVSGEFNDYFFEILAGIRTAAATHRQNTTIFTLPDWRSDFARLHDFCDNRTDGLILLAPTFDGSRTVLPADIPFVSIHANGDSPGIVNIESDEEHGAYCLVQHLIALGHRRIMHLAGPVGLMGAARRLRGYQLALADAGFPLDPQLQLTAGYSTCQGRETMSRWLHAHVAQPLPGAVFCANDACALGCLEAFAEAGLRVPEDVSVAGFDDTFMARISAPQLTTVRQPLADMGTRAVELLLGLVERRKSAVRAAVRPVVFPIELRLRASVDVPPRNQRVVPARDLQPMAS